ncbi:MAG: radical SAM protein [Lachnospiraceae bacterium]|nr:radical SAM protein [Lachnospiraceae bacterium]
MLKKAKNNSGLTAKIKKDHMQQLADYREETLRPNPDLRSLFLEITPFCNEHCLHCGSRCGDIDVSGMLTADEIKDILIQVKNDFDISNMRLCVTGGEPLLRPEFFEIMEFAKNAGFRWGMTSNGTLITKEVAQKLKETGLRTVSISVDGLKENHEWFRQSPGAYEKTIEGIKNLIEQDINHVQITTVIYHKNINELDAMYEEFKKVGVRSWRVINIEPIGRAKDNPDLMLSKAEYRKLFDFIRNKRFEDKMEVTYGCSHYLGVDMEREVRKWYFLCNAGVYTASIMYNGDIGGCLDIERRPELIQGNVRKDNFKEVWQNRFENFRNDFRKTGPCADCPDYKFCAGDSFHTWNFDEMKPNLCMKGILF